MTESTPAPGNPTDAAILPGADFDPAASSLSGQIAPEIMAELLSMRSSIDNIDATLVYVLAERFKATQRVGVLKARHKLPPADPDRESAQIARLRALAESAHLDPAFAEKFLNFIISEVIRHHQAISEDHAAPADHAAPEDHAAPADAAPADGAP
jgi:chorismate mutase